MTTTATSTPPSHRIPDARSGASGAVTPADLFGETLPGAFARVVATHGDRPAITDRSAPGRAATVTYGELGELADRAAGALRARGLRPGDRVGVHLDRRAELYAVFLGVLQAGAVVVPLNPDHPDTYVADLHRAAAPAVTVTDDGGSFRPVPDALTLPLGELLTPTPASAPGLAAPAGPGPEDPAFVLFTSGSTGTPKGVEIAHRGLARVARGLAGYEPGPEDVVLQLAQPSFAASTTDIWTCLLRGARMVVAPQRPPAPAALAELVADEGVTVLNLPVGLFNRLVEQHPDAFARARSVIVSGDFPSSWHLRRGLAVLGGTLFNAFGCTENSALTAVHVVTPEDVPDSADPVPVGYPMPGVTMSVRDERLRELPTGQVGELCLAGAGLALGYLDDPDRTAARFPVIDGERLLRTGDLARQTEHGEIVLAGRTDQLVKIRGFRVEPRQVEAAAEAVPGVGRAVVAAADGGNGVAAEELALWCVPQAGATVRSGEVVRALRARLPDHLVPSRVEVLDAFPLNTNGKIDRRALTGCPPELGPAGTEAATDPVGLVRRLLAEVTGTPIDIDVDLLDAGVTSLHLIDLGARLEEMTGVALAPDELVAAGTARAIADRIGGAA